MNRLLSAHHNSRWKPAFSVAGTALLVMTIAPVGAQAPDPHAQHHEAAPGAAAGMGSAESASAGMGDMSGSGNSISGKGSAAGSAKDGMMGGMEGMDDMSHANAPPPLYPSLMAMPELTPQRRQALESRADEYITRGRSMVSEASDRLTAAFESGDAAALEQATTAIREGLARFENGMALRRALAQSVTPRDTALDWFRREMNLVPLAVPSAPHGLFGLSWFHYIVMFIIAAFAIGMTVMRFWKMRLAEALMARLAGVPDGDDAAIPRTAVPSTSSLAARTPVAAPSQPAAEPMRAVVAPSKPNSWTGLLRVARIFQETATVKTFRLIDPLFGKLPFTYLPGQFLTVTIAQDGEPIKRSYTIASSPTERDYCEVTVKREEHGTVSRFLHEEVREDDTIQITAPSGRFTFTGEEATSVVLIAGGVGVTPMMSVTRYLTKRSWPHDIYFVYGVRAEEDIVFWEELQYLQRRYPNLHVIIFAEQMNPGDGRFVKGRLTREGLEARIRDLPSRRAHICGPPPMMNAVKAMLTEIGVPASQIHTEVFAGAEPRRQKLETVPATDKKVAVVSFARSRRTAMMPPTKTVLEASEDVGVNIEYSCRVGTCGVCRTRLLSGTVTMEVQDGLEPGDRENNIILACQAKSTADLSVDA